MGSLRIPRKAGSRVCGRLSCIYAVPPTTRLSGGSFPPFKRVEETCAQKQKAKGKTERVNGPTQERTNRQGNPNRSPTQAQPLRPKTQKPWRACGKQSGRPSTNESERTSKATQTEAQLNHSSSGQRPKSHGVQAGDSPRRNEQEQKKTRVSSHRRERRR